MTFSKSLWCIFKISSWHFQSSVVAFSKFNWDIFKVFLWHFQNSSVSFSKSHCRIFKVQLRHFQSLIVVFSRFHCDISKFYCSIFKVPLWHFMRLLAVVESCYPLDSPRGQNVTLGQVNVECHVRSRLPVWLIKNCLDAVSIPFKRRLRRWVINLALSPFWRGDRYCRDKVSWNTAIINWSHSPPTTRTPLTIVIISVFSLRFFLQLPIKNFFNIEKGII